MSGVALTAVLSLLLANLIDLHSIAILGSAGFLLIFAFVNAAAVRLSGEIGANRVVCVIAAIACGVALTALLANTWTENPTALFIFAGMLVAAVVFELSYGNLIRKRIKA